MNTDRYLKQLSDSSIFTGLTTQQLEKILPCITYSVKEYQVQQQIYAKGDIVGNLGLVLDGELAICRDGADGVRVIITMIGPNQLFGEALIFATGSAVPNDVFAIKASTVLYLASDFFMVTCGDNCPNKDSHGEVMRNMLRILSDRTQVLNRKIAYLSAPDLRTKLSMYFYDLHQSLGLLSFNLPLNRDGLAEYLAVARPSLSREMINLKKLGIINFHRSNLEILDLPRLYAIAYPN